MKQVKGSLFKYVIQIIRANKTGAFDSILTEEEKKFVNQEILDAVWYPYEVYKNLYAMVGKIEAKGEMDIIINSSYDLAKMVIKGMYKGLRLKRTIRHALTSYLHLIKLWFNFGIHKGEIISENEINISIADFDNDFELFYHSTLGWIKAFFEEYLNTSISAKITQKVWEGDDKTVYNLTWKS
ncbi:MAG: hypothetical protein ACFFBP_16270 [Promethearchaeota archaeon]